LFADLTWPLDDGTAPAGACYNRALVHLARGERPEALADLRRVLARKPDHSEARNLLDRVTIP
jgi:hypothetical protein